MSSPKVWAPLACRMNMQHEGRKPHLGQLCWTWYMSQGEHWIILRRRCTGINSGSSRKGLKYLGLEWPACQDTAPREKMGWVLGSCQGPTTPILGREGRPCREPSSVSGAMPSLLRPLRSPQHEKPYSHEAISFQHPEERSPRQAGRQ